MKTPISQAFNMDCMDYMRAIPDKHFDEISYLKSIYHVTKDGKIKEIRFVKKDGTEENIDVNNPRKDKKYLVSVNDYIAAGGDNFSMLNKIKQAEKVFDYDLTKCVEDYFRRHPEPVDIVDDGRIKVVDS